VHTNDTPLLQVALFIEEDIFKAFPISWFRGAAQDRALAIFPQFWLSNPE
jgi:hypothetical protein